MQTLYVAKRPFDPSVGGRWDRYEGWSGLSQLREVVSLDTMLCPTVPDELTAADWDHNVQADYQIFISARWIISWSAWQPRPAQRVGGAAEPVGSRLAAVTLPDFAFAGFDLVDVHGDISALTNCGGFEGVFGNAELSELGLLSHLGRAQEVQASLRTRYPEEHHAVCATSGPYGG